MQVFETVKWDQFSLNLVIGNMPSILPLKIQENSPKTFKIKTLFSIFGLILLCTILIWNIVLTVVTSEIHQNLHNLEKHTSSKINQNEQKILNQENNLHELEKQTSIYSPISCEKLQFYGISKSGFYFIDPGIDQRFNVHKYDPFQERPLEVFCDFEHNVTKIFHNQTYFI